jgi:hypothetical protein
LLTETHWPLFTCDIEHLSSFIQAPLGKKKKKKIYIKRERLGESNNYRERPGERRIVVFVIEANKICEAKTKSSYLASMGLRKTKEATNRIGAEC